jgi:acyl-homoserine lactone acylase PvdQ
MTRTFARAALVTALLMLLPAAAQARVIQAQTVLPPGQSGFVPASGTNPHLTDQNALYQSFSFKPAGFDLPGTTTTPFPGVTVTRDAFGVPNVHAPNDRALWKGVGFAIAQDRLVQLELFRRATEGRLAEVLGESRLESDIVARRDYYTPRELKRFLKRLPRALRARMDAYAEGVNAWIAQVAADPSKRPLELTALNLTMTPWRPVDSAAIGVQLARTIPSGDGAEIANWEALRKLGAKRFKALLPLRRKGQVATVPASAGRFPSTPGRTHRDERIGFKRSQRFLRTIKPPKAAVAQAALIRGGSDAWAIRGTGKHSFLFHGPQLGFEIPEQLAEFEVHRPGLDARGVTPPGLPLVGIGRNDHIAWADTSGSSDDDDLYAEKLKGRERYVYKGRTRKMSCRTETFKVAGKSDVKRRFCRTVHGPVQARSGKRTAFARKYAIWNHEMQTLVGLAQLNEADTVKDAAKAIAKVTWNENTMVADDRGNIGWFHPGRLPNKPKRWDERLPFPGTGNAEWRGILKVSQRPHVINPKQGWLANWNNAPSVGWTIGDAPDQDRNDGRLHRAAYLFGLVRQAAKSPTFAGVKAVDRAAGTHAQQRSLLTAKLRAADGGATGAAKALLDTVLAWDGDYDTTDAAGTVNPGVAAWEALKDAMVGRLPRASREWLGGPGGSHRYDFGGADAVAFLRLGASDMRKAAATAAGALTAKFGTPDPAKWRDPRLMYEMSATGLATPPPLKFYDRGTWQEAYELGP